MRKPRSVLSLLDTDLYKLTMMQVAWLRHSDVQVKFAFTNRTKEVRLANTISIQELKRELDLIRKLRFTQGEISYLSALGLFHPDFIRFLEFDFLLPEIQISEEKSDVIRIETQGSWPNVTMWETFIMSAVNYLHFDSLCKSVRNTIWLSTFGMNTMELATGNIRLENKVASINKTGITFSDFGTRRRRSPGWHRFVLMSLKNNVPNTLFRGTSNLHFARELGLKPIGTFAHEMPMVYSGIYREADDTLSTFFSHLQMLKDWEEVYENKLSIALSDTFGSDFFFKVFEKLAHRWSGVRHDSGDPVEFGKRVIDYYRDLGIDPTSKTIVFSDGLTVEKMIEIENQLGDQIHVTFGWGTNLTNDVGNDPISIVVKAVEADGYPLVKLSDNPEKAIGPKHEISRAKRLAGYDDTKVKPETCTY